MAFTDSPLRYPGGKSCLNDLMKDVLRHNGLWLCTYAEPFAGGAGLALRLMFEGSVSRIFLNDIDPAIWSFWDAVLNRNDELAARIENAVVTIDEWHRQRDVFKAGLKEDSLDLGFAAFFLNRTNRSGIIKGGGVIGGLDQTGAYKIDCRFNRVDLASRVRRIARYKSRITLTRLDAVDFMDLFESEERGPSLVCIDPPYFVRGSSLYTNFYRRDDHAILADRVLRLKSSWVMTYDDAPEIESLYEARRRFRFSINYSAQEKRIGTELMVLSDDIELPLSLSGRVRAA